MSRFGMAMDDGQVFSSRVSPRNNSGRSARRPTRRREAWQPSDLTHHRLIHSVKSQAQWPRWFAMAGVEPAVRWRKVLFDRSHMAIDAAAGGLGIALESTLMTERELAEGRLIRPVRDAPEIRLVTQWIVCPRDHLRRRRVQLFLEWLRSERESWQARTQ